jgi:hypothetical protein
MKSKTSKTIDLQGKLKEGQVSAIGGRYRQKQLMASGLEIKKRLL